jgi:hypothetical protein
VITSDPSVFVDMLPAPQRQRPSASHPALVAAVLLFVAVARVPSACADEWRTVAVSRGSPTPRDEACFVMVAGKAYLIGGRGVHPTDVFDPADHTWTAKSPTPKEISHMQCVAYNNSVYIAGGWYGRFPYEQNHPEMFVYDTDSDAWSTRPYLPNNPERRRGSAAFVLSDDHKMYLIGGNIGGHGSHSKAQALFDVYDPVRNTWNERGMLPDAIHRRDHTGGAMVGGRLCVASGRDGGQADFFNSPVLPVDCFDFQSRTWSAGPNMPHGRAGAAVGQDRSGRLIVAGGEGFGRAYNHVDVFDGHSWNSIAPLNAARHGTGLAVGSFNCTGHMYIAAGVGLQGGSNELITTEEFVPSGTADASCRPRYVSH